MAQLLLHVGGGKVVHQQHGGVGVAEVVGVPAAEPGFRPGPFHGRLDHTLRDFWKEVPAG